MLASDMTRNFNDIRQAQKVLRVDGIVAEADEFAGGARLVE